MSDNFWGEPIYSYSRQQAIEDDVLVDVSIMAQESGFCYPTAVTRRVWDELVVPDEDSRNEGQCEPGRLSDILWMLRMTGPVRILSVVMVITYRHTGNT